ncbi:MAG: chemotaxis protein CheB [Planctomycetota bacterium]
MIHFTGVTTSRQATWVLWCPSPHHCRGATANHLSPDRESLLSEILTRETQMPVTEVRDNMALEPNCIYVIPPNTKMILSEGVLHLSPREKIQGKHMPVDVFFSSLAAECKSQAIAIVLSGTDGDGAVGLEEVKAAGGITFAQCEATAEFQGMPNTAAATGQVDFIMSPQAIAEELVKISRHPYVTRQTLATEKSGEESALARHACATWRKRSDGLGRGAMSRAIAGLGSRDSNSRTRGRLGPSSDPGVPLSSIACATVPTPRRRSVSSAEGCEKGDFSKENGVASSSYSDATRRLYQSRGGGAGWGCRVRGTGGSAGLPFRKCRRVSKCRWRPGSLHGSRLDRAPQPSPGHRPIETE